MPKSKQNARAKIDVHGVRQSLLAWYAVNSRTLPWRADQDPYRVWVSEVMLQQTRVETVKSYYDRWLERFPTVNALADADLDDVLKHWEGLGYYSRARNLHGAARVVRGQHAGRIPSDYNVLRSLPGIGEYTAGAVSSIAFGYRSPAIDGNVRRVITRLFDIAAPATAVVRNYATELVDPERPGDFNQAMMELGATVCMPRNPRCGPCPLRATCQAYKLGTVALRPAPKPRRVIPHYRVDTLVHLDDGRVHLVRRPDQGLLAGLWEFPEVEIVPAEATLIGEITHTFSHKRITYVVHVATGPRPGTRDGHTVTLGAVHGRAMPVAQQKIERLVHAWATDPGSLEAADDRTPSRPAVYRAR